MTLFTNQHLSAMDITVTDLALQMHDGVYFIILVGSLGNFFVPLARYTMHPTTLEEKVGQTHIDKRVSHLIYIVE